MKRGGWLITKSKFGNTKCTFAGREFDSKLEMNRYMFLKAAEDAGRITGLKCQDRLELIPKQGDLRRADYVADFTYYRSDGTWVVEDTKGYETDVFKLKEKIFLQRYGFRIRKVRSATEVI